MPEDLGVRLSLLSLLGETGKAEAGDRKEED